MQFGIFSVSDITVDPTTGRAPSEAERIKAILRIAASDGIQERLRREPALIPSAAEEFMRHETPVQAMVRYPVRDVELDGRTLRAGASPRRQQSLAIGR